MEYDNNNRGALWRNETASPENKQPTHTGNLNVGGKDFVLSGWMKEAVDGKKARLDLKIQEPQSREVVASNDSSTSTTDGVPF